MRAFTVLGRISKILIRLLRLFSDHRNIKIGKELALGDQARKKVNKIGLANQARILKRYSLRGSDRLHEDDGYRRD